MSLTTNDPLVLYEVEEVVKQLLLANMNQQKQISYCKRRRLYSPTDATAV